MKFPTLQDESPGPSANLILQSLNSSERMSPWPVSSTLKTSMTGDWGFLSILQTPSSVIVCPSPGSRQYFGRYEELRVLTLEKRPCKVHTHVCIPARCPPCRHGRGDTLRVYVCDVHEDAVAGPEPDDDLGNAEQEGLYPVLHELAVEILFVAIVADLRASLELNPIDGLGPIFGKGVPDYVVRWFVCEVRKDILASTSPPRQRTVLPMPVRTTEQYCAVLLTIWSSRPSM